MLSTFFLSPFVALASDQICQEEKTERKVYMEQVLDHVGFCGPFAFRALLNETLCLANPDDCNLPSMAEIAATLRFGKESQELGIQSFLQNYLEKLHNNGYYDEKCLPFEVLYSRDELPTEKLDWTNNFAFHSKRFFSNYLKDSYDHEKECFNKNYFSTNPLPLSEIANLEMGPDLFYKLKEEVYKTTAQKNKCKAHPLPKIKVTSTKIDSDPVQKIQDLLKSGPVMVGLNIKQNNSEKIDSHAVVLTNYEKVCCFGTCEVRYHLLDSLGHYWASGHDKGWVSEEDLFKALDRQRATQFEISQ